MSNRPDIVIQAPRWRHDFPRQRVSGAKSHPEVVIPMADKLLPSLNFLAPVRRSGLPNRSRREAVQE